MQTEPYVYLKLVAQPLDVRFTFVSGETQEWDENGRHILIDDSSEGVPQVHINVGGRQYGPYRTTFKTTYNAWVWRKSVRPSRESILIQSQVGELTKRLIDAWSFYPKGGADITADMMFQRAGLKVFEVAEGGALYVI